MKTDNEHPSDNIVITIGRQFGSGGRELGRKLASLLSFDYYDKEILSVAASSGDISEEFMRDHDERTPSVMCQGLSFSMGLTGVAWYQTVGVSGNGSDSVYLRQSEAIRHVAAKGPCVIVGRAADYILRSCPKLVTLFVHAPMEACIDRIMQRGDVTDRAKARSLWERTNRLRSSFYNYYTEKHWGEALSYDLTFDTSRIPVDDIAELVASYVRRRFPNS